MKLLRCKKCKEFTIEPQATVRVSFYARWYPGDNTIRCNDPDFDIGNQEWSHGEYTLSCPAWDEDDEDEKCKGDLEVVEVAECPHKWRSNWGNTRRCELCGIEQRGELVFPG